MNNPNPNLNQITVTGRLKEGRGGSELIVFNLTLAFFNLTFIVTIPEQGTNQAPVYVKFGITQPQNSAAEPAEENSRVFYRRQNRVQRTG